MKPWVTILIKSVVLFFIAIAFVRITGKKHLSRMNSFNFINYSVVAILIALISVNVINNWVFGILALFIWFILPIGLDYICMKSKFMYNLINGKELVIIKEGKIMEKNLQKIRYSGEDLLKELRFKNIFKLADVEFAVMESTGDINVVLKSDKKPITPKDLGMKIPHEGPPQTVILDGNIVNESLSNLGFNQGWLNTQLELLGVCMDNVFVGQVDSNGELYVDLFDDVIEVPKCNVREMLYANLEKVKSDLMSFGLETENKEAEDIYKKDSAILNGVLEELKPYLLR